jgi:glucose/arabinose dehydrogenase
MKSCFRLSTAFLAIVCSWSGVSLAQSNIPNLTLRNAFPDLKFTRPLWLEEIPDGSKRMIVLEQGGTVYLLPKGRESKEAKMFLDISSRRPFVQNEEGLLALAFHPQFKNNGLLYIYYSQQNPKRGVLSELHISKTDPDTADLTTERILLQTSRPYWNHDGGTLLFGPDGYLYVSFGDGGAADDPHNNGQNLKTWLAKILRIDVNTRTGNLQYGIPSDNPFVKGAKPGAGLTEAEMEGALPEIWAYGLRNVWRMSFDRETGELWAGDVGQNLWEEIDLITKGGNYGWRVREAFHPFRQQQQPVGTPIDPVIEYPHSPRLSAQSKFPNHGPGVSVTGGYVYRGKKVPSLQGVYVYADYQVGTIWGLRHAKGQVTAADVLVKGMTRQVSSFAEDRDGELYVLAFDGLIYEFVEAK